MKLFPILLADNGTEFSNPEALEFGPDGERRSWVFYCNPSAPNEKGACENNHEFIRRVIPKSKDIGKYSQEQINLMMNHINSYSRPELGNKPRMPCLPFITEGGFLRNLVLKRSSLMTSSSSHHCLGSMINCSIIRSGSEVKGQYAGRFFSSARAALDEVTRITLLSRKGTTVPFPAFPARE